MSSFPDNADHGIGRAMGGLGRQRGSLHAFLAPFLPTPATSWRFWGSAAAQRCACRERVGKHVAPKLGY